ncbi:serine/threonine-protein kinase TOUSLED [Cyclospora cayetanensis]|uniref:Serine/threonine-protein kinase TOUSLED n=1 Tax=Cyclospora cayetanensis TaxID=88456 RepID=A0A6P6RRP0_9EIME|nr:serine/threonine-protein kinase TOUSLED [Cyclospora cayetanensis]
MPPPRGEWRFPVSALGAGERLMAWRQLNRLLLDAKRQLDAGRYRLLKQMRLLLAQSNSPFNNFYQLRRGYRLLNMLGRGGFAEVWEVFDPLTCSVAAAKLHVLSAVKKERERLKIVRRVQNEIEIHKDIRPHPFIVEMKACFEMGNDVLASILQALHYLKHQPNGSIYHLDVKPGNVLLQKGNCKLADFGLSCFVPRGETRPFAGGGTLWYQPPECLLLQLHQHHLRQKQQQQQQQIPQQQQQQMAGEMGREHVKGELASTEKQEQRLELLEVVPADEKIDIWAVGCILFEMLFNKCVDTVRKEISGAVNGGGGAIVAHFLLEHIIAEAKKGLVIPKGPRKISDGAEDLLYRLLAYNPRERLTLEEALAHDFLQRSSEEQGIADRIEETLVALERLSVGACLCSSARGQKVAAKAENLVQAVVEPFFAHRGTGEDIESTLTRQHMCDL